MNRENSILGRLPNWLIAALDQMSFSLITFLTTMILSRIMSVESFSEFSIAFAIFLFGALLHQSLVIDPMLMAAKKNQRIFQHFLIVSAVVSLVCALVCALVLSLFMNKPPSWAFFIFSFIMLNLYFVRRSLIILDRLYISAIVGLVALLFQIVLLIVFSSTIEQNPNTAYYFLALPGVFSIVIMMVWMGGKFNLRCRLFSVCFSRSMYYGRWIGLGSFCSWPVTNIYYFTLPIYVGLSAVSEFKILFTLMMPATQLVTAVCIFCLPKLSKIKSDCVSYDLFYRKILIFSVMSSFVYFLFCSVFIINFDDYMWGGVYDFSFLDVVLSSLYMLSMNLVSVSLILLKSKGITKSIFKGNLVALIFSLLAGGVLVYWGGVQGAFVSLSLSLLFMSAYFFRSSKVRGLSSGD